MNFRKSPRGVELRAQLIMHEIGTSSNNPDSHNELIVHYPPSQLLSKLKLLYMIYPTLTYYTRSTTNPIDDYHFEIEVSTKLCRLQFKTMFIRSAKKMLQ